MVSIFETMNLLIFLGVIMHLLRVGVVVSLFFTSALLAMEINSDVVSLKITRNNIECDRNVTGTHIKLDQEQTALLDGWFNQIAIGGKIILDQKNNRQVFIYLQNQEVVGGFNEGPGSSGLSYRLKSGILCLNKAADYSCCSDEEKRDRFEQEVKLLNQYLNLNLIALSSVVAQFDRISSDENGMKFKLTSQETKLLDKFFGQFELNRPHLINDSNMMKYIITVTPSEENKRHPKKVARFTFGNSPLILVYTLGSDILESHKQASAGKVDSSSKFFDQIIILNMYIQFDPRLKQIQSIIPNISVEDAYQFLYGFQKICRGEELSNPIDIENLWQKKLAKFIAERLK